MPESRAKLVLIIVTALGVLAGALGGFAKAATTPTQFQAQSRVLVSVSPDAEAWVPGASAAQIQTFSELVSTAYVLDPVAAAMGLGRSADKLPGTVRGHVALSTNIIDIQSTAGSDEAAKTLANQAQTSLIRAISEVGPRSAKGKAMMNGVSIARATQTKASRSSLPVLLLLGAGIGGLIGLAVGRPLAARFGRDR